MKEISINDLEELTGEGTLFIVTRDSTSYSFNENCYRISNDTIFCWDGRVKRFKDSGFKNSTNLFVDIPSIERVDHYEIEPVNTTILTVGSIALVAGIIYIIHIIVILNND